MGKVRHRVHPRVLCARPSASLQLFEVSLRALICLLLAACFTRQFLVDSLPTAALPARPHACYWAMGSGQQHPVPAGGPHQHHAQHPVLQKWRGVGLGVHSTSGLCWVAWGVPWCWCGFLWGWRLIVSWVLSPALSAGRGTEHRQLWGGLGLSWGWIPPQPSPSPVGVEVLQLFLVLAMLDKRVPHRRAAVNALPVQKVPRS